MSTPDDALDRVHADIARAHERAARMGELRAAMEAVHGIAVSPSRTMEVRVDVSGVLTDIAFAPAVSTLDHRRLAAEILSTYTAARQDAQRQAGDVTRDILGDDDPIAAKLTEPQP